MSVRRLERIVINCVDPQALARFYAAAFGFEVLATSSVAEPAFGALLALPGARACIVSLRLGSQRVDLMQIEPPGRPYPENVSGADTRFQHFAVEVADVPRSVARLQSRSGWTSITTGGPQRLPATSGGVTAFKFRDPQGHPLELISPAPAASAPEHPRVAHSALSVASSARSIAFYARLGLTPKGGSLNIGVEQERLDGLAGARVRVTALGFDGGSEPHVELLCYDHPITASGGIVPPNDAAADWLVLAVDSETEVRSLAKQFDTILGLEQFGDGAVRCLLTDPDGHWLCLESSAAQ